MVAMMMNDDSVTRRCGACGWLCRHAAAVQQKEVSIQLTKGFNIPRTVGDSIFFRKLTRLSRVIWLGFQIFFSKVNSRVLIGRHNSNDNCIGNLIITAVKPFVYFFMSTFRFGLAPIFASDQIPKRGTINLSLSKHNSIDVLIGISRAKKQPRESLQQ